MRGRLPMILTLALLASVRPAGTAGADTGWTPVTPALTRPDNVSSATLHDVTAVSPSDVWTVGSGWGDGSSVLIAHWDGAGWRHSAELSTPEVEYALWAVDAVSTGDVWAAGYGQARPQSWDIPFTAVFAHYDGTAWSFVAAPAPPPGNSYLLGDLDMISATDGWAVGRRTGSPLDGPKSAQPLAMRWRNGQWVTVSLPQIAGGNAMLEAVHARADNDVWAVGYQGSLPLVMHFDGTRWKRVGVPGGVGDSLRGVAAVSAGEVWAVGSTCVGVGEGIPCRPLALHLSDGRWRVVPTTGDGGTNFLDVTARAADDVWVVGYGGSGVGSETNHVEHWDGVRFTTASSSYAPQGGLASALEAVTRIPGTAELWAVGWQDGAPQVIWHG